MRARWTWLEIASIASITTIGIVLRWWHLDQPSLWWDEIIHVGTSQQRDVWEVIRRVKLGSPPGSGNAGAVPLDYLLLYGWQRLVSFPDPEHLEAYFRFPSFVWSSLTPLALHVLTRRCFGPAAGLAAAMSLALAPFHVAYAVEARFYSLFGLMTVLNLLCFEWVVTSRRALAWWTFALHGALYFASGLFGLLVLAIEYAVLGIDVARRWWRRRVDPDAWRAGELVFLLATGGIIALVPVFYYRGTDLLVKTVHARPPIDTWKALGDASWLFVSGRTPLAVAACLGLGLLVWQAWRNRVSWPIAAGIVLTALGVCPAILEIERWKLYYFHPRHAVFLMPVVALLVGGGIGSPLTWMVGRRRWLALVGAPLLVAASLASTARAYVRLPRPTFARTKLLRDVPSLMRELSAQLRDAPPGSKIILLSPGVKGGKLINVSIIRYLEWWGLSSRVVFRSYPILDTALRRVERACQPTCRGRPGLPVERALAPLEPPVNMAPDTLRLLGTDGSGGGWPGKVWSVVVVDYHGRTAQRPGFVATGLFGFRRWYLPADRPPPPSTFVTR